MRNDSNAPASPGAFAGANTESLLRLPSVLKTVQGGRTWWLDLVKAGKAPAPVRIGRATFWTASSVQSWIADRVRESRGAQ